MRWSSMASLPLLDSYKDAFAGASPFSGLREVKMHYLTALQLPHRIRLRNWRQMTPRKTCYIRGGLTRRICRRRRTIQLLSVHEICGCSFSALYPLTYSRNFTPASRFRGDGSVSYAVCLIFKCIFVIKYAKVLRAE